MFEQGVTNAAVAKTLRVTQRSVERWRRAWREGGTAALASAGPSAPPRLSPAQLARLETELQRGPLAHGFADQRWTLMRIKTLIGMIEDGRAGERERRLSGRVVWQAGRRWVGDLLAAYHAVVFPDGRVAARPG